MKKISLFYLAAACLLAASCCDKYDKGPSLVADSHSALVQTQSGTVSGYIEDGIYTYKGIPYAKAERFMPPQDPDSWEGVRSCLYYGHQCWQAPRTGWESDKQAFIFHWDDGTQSDDCQVLNVWTKGINDGKKRPVMVWLHGGGFAMGAGDELPFYDGANLAKKDVVTVTINHRLNVIGYLDLSSFGEKYKYSGVAGVMDMVKALEWVKNNIANFGGDPDNVMIFGQSGGGMKVNILLGTPSAKGLFHKAAIQSGSMLMLEDKDKAEMVGELTAAKLGLNEKTIDQIQTIPYDKLLAAATDANNQLTVPGAGFSMGFSPVLDGEIIPYDLKDPRLAEISKDIPTIIGYNYVEQTMTDAVYENADLRYAINPGAQYVYIFKKESPLLDGKLQSMHCMEMSYVFDNIYLGRFMTGTDKSSYKLADLMSNVWVSFAKDSNPNIKKFKWEKYNPETRPVVVFDDKVYTVHAGDEFHKIMASQAPFMWDL